MLFPARRFKKESLVRDCFFVKIVEMLGCFGDFEVQQECRGGLAQIDAKHYADAF